MQVCTSLQTDNHASTPPLKFFTGWVPFLPPNQQRQSTEGRERNGQKIEKRMKKRKRKDNHKYRLTTERAERIRIGGLRHRNDRLCGMVT